LEGDTGPDLLICYARLCSAIATIGVQLKPEETPHIDYSSLWDPPWCDLLRLMARYPTITQSAFRTMEPATVLSYTFQIVEEVTSCLDEADEDASGGEGSSASSKYSARAVLFESVRQILDNAMTLLGITPISKWEGCRLSGSLEVIRPWVVHCRSFESRASSYWVLHTHRAPRMLWQLSLKLTSTLACVGGGGKGFSQKIRLP